MYRCEKYGMILEDVLNSGTAYFADAAYAHDERQLYDLADDVRDWTKEFLTNDYMWITTYTAMVALLNKGARECSPVASDNTIYTYALGYLSDKYGGGEGIATPETVAIFSACLAIALRDGMLSDLRDLR